MPALNYKGSGEFATEIHKSNLWTTTLKRRAWECSFCHTKFGIVVTKPDAIPHCCPGCGISFSEWKEFAK